MTVVLGIFVTLVLASAYAVVILLFLSTEKDTHVSETKTVLRKKVRKQANRHR